MKPSPQKSGLADGAHEPWMACLTHYHARSAFHEQGRVGPAVEAIPTLDKAVAFS